MSQERTEAVVLRGVDFSETSRIVTFLCPNRGRMACMAKGVRRAKSGAAAVLDTFNRVELVYYWKDGRGIQTLGEATLDDDFSEVKADLDKVTYAAFPLEIVCKVAHENEPSEQLYRDLVTGLEALGRWRGNVRAHVCWQAWRLLSAAGFEPAVAHCASCGADIGGRPGFDYDGGVTCSACRSDRKLSDRACEALRHFSQVETCPEDLDVAELFNVLHRYAARQLETDFRSVRVIKQMFGAEPD